MIKSNIRSLSGVLFITLIFLVFVVTTVCAENRNPTPIDKYQTKLLGVAGRNTYGNGIAIDSAGNCYITGFTDGNLDGQMKKGGFWNSYIVKYDANYNKQWTKLLQNDNCAEDIAIDSVGNCYITGYTYDNLDGQIKTGYIDAFIVKYDANGNKQWTKLIGVAASNTYGNGIAIDSAGNCYITGYTEGNLDGQIKIGERDTFTAKYDANGNQQWTKLIEATQTTTIGYGIAIDNADNCYIVGDANGDFNGQIKTGYIDAFIVKYDANGNQQWTKLIGADEKSTHGGDIVIDSVGNCYIVGDTEGDLNGQTKIGFRDAFIVKYDANGNQQWTKLIGATQSTTYGQGIAIDIGGNSYITGFTDGNLDGQTKTGKTDAFIVKYDANENQQWTKLLGVAASNTYGNGIAIDSADKWYITGWTNGNLDEQIKTGIWDAFIISKVNP